MIRRFLLCAMLLVLGAPAAAQDDRVLAVACHMFAAGGNVRVTDGAADDTFLAGGRVFAAGTYQ